MRLRLSSKGRKHVSGVRCECTVPHARHSWNPGDKFRDASICRSCNYFSDLQAPNTGWSRNTPPHAHGHLADRSIRTHCPSLKVPMWRFSAVVLGSQPGPLCAVSTTTFTRLRVPQIMWNHSVVRSQHIADSATPRECVLTNTHDRGYNP